MTGRTLAIVGAVLALLVAMATVGGMVWWKLRENAALETAGKPKKKVKGGQLASGLLSGAAAGAGIGTAALPGIGTAIGAGIGGLLGAIAGASA